MIQFDLDQHDINHVHFIGIGGISMSAIAEVLLSFGYTVSGSDMNPSKLTEKLSRKGAQIFIGHHEDHLKPCDLVVYTAAVKQDNLELMKARQMNIPVIERSVMLGLLMKKFDNSIAVSGTHGKTTTTSMISLILEHAQYHPTIMVGGELDEIGGNVKIGNRDYFVTEACEYVESFLKFFPKIGIILNIDEDHLDYFKDIHHIVESFIKFAQLIPQDGFLLAFNDDPHIKKLLTYIQCPMVTYGKDNTSNYWPQNITYNEQGFPAFDIMYKNTFLGRLQLSIPGQHNIFNALAATACCYTIGVPIHQITESLSRFKGTHRRFDILGKFNNITVIDDYAHHPTEVKATLEGASKYPHKELWCVFQPHTYTRTRLLLNDFALAFQNADHVIITDIYAAREKNSGEIHSKDLAEAIKKHHSNAIYMDNFEDITQYLRQHAQPNDLILTMGAGDIYKVGEMLVKSKE